LEFFDDGFTEGLFIDFYILGLESNGSISLFLLELLNDIGLYETL